MSRSCNCDDCREGRDRREEIRRGGVTEEELPHRPTRRSKNKRWCKGKEGREHRFEQKLRWSYKYTDSSGVVRENNSYNWVCAGCGKTEWSKPEPVVPEHKHCFCETKINRLWRREEIFESCCVCGKRGKSYSYYVGR